MSPPLRRFVACGNETEERFNSSEYGNEQTTFISLHFAVFFERVELARFIFENFMFGVVQ